MDSSKWPHAPESELQSPDVIDITGEEPMEESGSGSVNVAERPLGHAFSFDNASGLYGRTPPNTSRMRVAANPLRRSVDDLSLDAIGARRHSQRSVKRRRFDDELVESSLVRHERARHRLLHGGSGDGGTGEAPGTALLPTAVLDSHAASVTVQPTLSLAVRQVSQSRGDIDRSDTVHPVTAASRRKVKGSLKGRRGVGRRRSLLKREAVPPVVSPVDDTAVVLEAVAKDPGRWTAYDDFLLIQAVQQTCDLATVHTCVKFSSAFSLRDIQERWYALLYSKSSSKRARSAIQLLPPDVVARLSRRAPFSAEEEVMLGAVASGSQATLETFAELLAEHATVFHSARTAQCLFKHWLLMRSYQLLPGQVLPKPPLVHQPLAGGECVPKGTPAGASRGSAQPQTKGGSSEQQFSFSDAEEAAIKEAEQKCDDTGPAAGAGDQETRLVTDAVKYELSILDRRQKREIRRLEAELPLWQALISNAVEDVTPKDFDDQTFAVLRGQIVRYLMRSRKVTFGRATVDNFVDIDLSLEGPSFKVSRQQGSIQLLPDGEFLIENQGQRPLYVDGKPVICGSQHRLCNNSVVELCSMRFVFCTNYAVTQSARSELRRRTAGATLSTEAASGGSTSFRSAVSMPL